jgi:hypothetical protein
LSDLSLSLFPRKCKHIDCNSTAGVFGVCRAHEFDAVRRQYLKLVVDGSALPEAPKCFDSTRAYREYAVAFYLAQPSGHGSQFFVDHCRDCEPKFKKRMVEAGRCSHPETVFIRSERFAGDTIGVSMIDLSKSAPWESAVMGMSGPVVSMPDPEVIDKIVTQLSEKRRIGRPRKVSVVK